MSDDAVRPGWITLTSVDNKPIIICAHYVTAYEENIGSGCTVYMHGNRTVVKEPHQHITRLMRAAL